MKKIINIVFSVLFIFILVLPILFVNKETEQVSTIDNTILTEWPEGDFSLNNSDSYSTYFEQRVGFRKEAIALYIAPHLCLLLYHQNLLHYHY